MILKFLIFAGVIALVSSDTTFGISSAFLHITTPPKNAAFTEYGRYTGKTYNNVRYKKTYYFSQIFIASWVEAKSICRAFDMELVTFETSNEATDFLASSKIQQYFEPFERKYLHVDGITKLPNLSTEWYWTNSGEKIPYYLQWAPNEPNYTHKYEYCLTIGKSSKNSRIGFNDHRCSDYPTHFLCQTTEMLN